MNSTARRIAATGIAWAERLARPGVTASAAASRNFLLPQFQAALGTAVHATPVVEALGSAVPGARIVVAGSGFAEEVYRGNPHVTELLAMPSPLRSLRAALRAMRAADPFAGEPYTTLLTTGNERTKIVAFAALAGASRRVGFAVIPELLHAPLQWDPQQSQIGNNLRLLQVLGVPAASAKALREPRIYTSAAQVTAAEQRLVQAGSSAGSRRIALVTQTSPTQRKGWRAERWVRLANYLIAREGASLVFVGTAGEAAAIDEIRGRIPHPTVSVAGKTGIAELAAIFRCCDLGVTLDTGPLHVGRAVGLPMVIIAPAWSPVHEWLPVGDERYRILKNADFAPPAPEDYVIDEVEVEEVIAAVHDLLRQTSPLAAPSTLAAPSP